MLMKHIKNIELFERAINRAMMPIGDFLFDTFFSASYVKITEGLSNNKKYYGVNIIFKYDIWKKSSLQHFLEFKKYIKPYCVNKCLVQSRPGHNYTRSGMSISFGNDYYRTYKKVIIQLGLNPKSVEEIKNTPEYKLWYDNIKDRYEDLSIRRMAKKYNL